MKTNQTIRNAGRRNKIISSNSKVKPKVRQNIRCTEIPRIKEIPSYEISDLSNFKRSKEMK